MTGSGTALDPYVIWDVNDLQDMGNGAPYALDAHYRLGQDIDASVTVGWNGGQGFIPRGTSGFPFTGRFNGQFFRISNLHINRPADTHQALFGRLSAAIVENVFIMDATVTGSQYVAICAGSFSNNTIVRRVTTSGVVSASHNNSHVGGLLGSSTAGSNTVYRCVSFASVTGRWYTGGLLGWPAAPLLHTITISQCYATGNVNGLMGACGGLIGQTQRCTISDCFARGNVTGGTTGGLIGITWEGDSVTNCYSTGNPNGGGGLIGQRFGAPMPVINSFWDVNTSGTGWSAGGTGLTTAQMKTKTTFTGVGWDFVTIWDIDDVYAYWNDGYPFFLWNPIPTIVVTSPNGGEVWYAGDTHTIFWHHTEDPGANVVIDLLLVGVLDEVIVASTPIGPPGGGTYSWTIDSGKAQDVQYRVRVTSTTAPFTDSSDSDFTIKRRPTPPPEPTVITLPATGVG